MLLTVTLVITGNFNYMYIGVMYMYACMNSPSCSMMLLIEYYWEKEGEGRETQVAGV